MMLLSGEPRRVVGQWLGRWGIPLFAMVLGAAIATKAGLVLACGCAARGDMTEYLVGGLFFTVTGLTAVLARMRGALPLAQGSVLAIGAGMMFLMVAQATGDWRALNGPRQVVVGQLASVTSTGRKHGVALILNMADGRRYDWGCDNSNCNGRDVELAKLRWEAPVAAELEVAGHLLVGLKVADVQLLDPAREVPRQSSERQGTTIIFGLIMAVLFLAIYALWWSGRRHSRQRSDPGASLTALRRFQL